VLLKKILIHNNFMYKLLEDINKSVLFNEFMKKSTFRTYHVIEAKKRYVLFICNYTHTIHKNTQTQDKQTCSCTQMFLTLRESNPRPLRNRRVFGPLR
jgi:hypothetical protein